MSTLHITPLDGPLGAVVTGLDLRQRPGSDDRAALRAALADRLLLVAPGQFLDLDGHRTPRGGQAAEVWHADASFTAQPPAFTMLSAQVVPAHGGATSFANQQAAYQLLDDAWHERLAELRAVHAPGPQQLRRAPWLTPSVHPVVREDPDTGRRSLFVNPGFTRRFEDLTVEASRPSLAALFRVALDPTVQHDHRWEPGDLVVWDNRALLHRAHHDHGDEARVLGRVTIAA